MAILNKLVVVVVVVVIDCNLKFQASKGHDMSFNEKHITLRYLLLSSFPRV